MKGTLKRAVRLWRRLALGVSTPLAVIGVLAAVCANDDGVMRLLQVATGYQCRHHGVTKGWHGAVRMNNDGEARHGRDTWKRGHVG